MSSALRSLISGSPPRMRERLETSISVENGKGITPAYAGKTARTITRCRSIRDHPRVCGKDYLLVLSFRSLLGSPPRMRERPYSYLFIFYLLGITPAYAGKTREIDARVDTDRDHPRVCGKDKSSSSPQYFSMGSPPRMRERHLKSQ